MQTTVPLSMSERVGVVWRRHRTLFWALHSGWALTAGTGIVLLARERYHLVLWVILFLTLAWVSTLFFARAAVEATGPPSFGHEVISYFTRVLYQQTLFFLLPFYAYSTVIESPNVLFLALLGGLAVLSCIDLLFDRWLRRWPVFALTFFALIAFAAINLLLPLLVGLPAQFSAPIAATLAVAGAAPLALRRAPRGLGPRLRLVFAGGVMLGVPVGLPSLIPPVPLRLERATFASAIDRNTLALSETLPDHVSAAAAGRSLFVVVEVFAPSSLPATVQLEWRRDGDVLRVSREVAITAHAEGFRLWDAWSSESGSVSPGRYRVVLQTAGRRVFGVAEITVDD
jgi:hypothetical protein